MRSTTTAVWAAAAAVCLMLAPACAHAPVAPATPATPPGPPPVLASLDTKVSWILRLEQQRTLRDAAASSDALPPGSDVPDLERLAADPSPVVRRRALLGIGRAGVAEGRTTLAAALSDPDADVRAAAAFGLGLLGVKETVPGLVTALADPALPVRVRALDALGLIADPGAAPAVAASLAGCADRLAIDPDNDQPQTDEVEVCRAGLFALVRLGNFDALASVDL
jgi:HEAT repeat protein